VLCSPLGPHGLTGPGRAPGHNYPGWGPPYSERTYRKEYGVCSAPYAQINQWKFR